ncbi:hypothetical protein D351_01598, partial [Enterococcus faecalis WKS-26-18-2]
MTKEITTEELAKAIDAIKKTVQKETDTVTLDIQRQKTDYQIIHKAASTQ